MPSADYAILKCAFSLDDSSRMTDALGTGCEWRSAYDEASECFADAAWGAEILPHRSALENGRNFFLTRLGPKHRRASKCLEGLLHTPLPKSADDRLALADKLLNVQKLRRRLDDDEPYLKDKLGAHWRGERTACPAPII